MGLLYRPKTTQRRKLGYVYISEQQYPHQRPTAGRQRTKQVNLVRNVVNLVQREQKEKRGYVCYSPRNRCTAGARTARHRRPRRATWLGLLKMRTRTRDPPALPLLSSAPGSVVHWRPPGSVETVMFVPPGRTI